MLRVMLAALLCRTFFRDVVASALVATLRWRHYACRYVARYDTPALMLPVLMPSLRHTLY